MGDGKRFIGYEIVRRLKAKGMQDVLLQLENAVNNSDKKKGGCMKCGKIVLTGRNATAQSLLCRK